MAGCYEFIIDKNLFHKGFATIVGEKASKISGG